MRPDEAARQDRLDRIGAAIRSGSYKVAALAVADAMLEFYSRP